MFTKVINLILGTSELAIAQRAWNVERAALVSSLGLGRAKLQHLESTSANEKEERETYIKDLENKVDTLKGQLEKAKKKQSKASHRINDLKHEHENEHRALKNFNTARENDCKRLELEKKQLTQAWVDACRCLAVAVFGDHAEPPYDGKTVPQQWFAGAVANVNEQQRKYKSARNAIQSLIGYLEHVEADHAGEQDTYIIAYLGVKPGSVHEGVVRLGDIKRVLAALREQEPKTTPKLGIPFRG